MSLASRCARSIDYSPDRCWWCGAPFSPRQGKRYCSLYCRRAAWYVLNPMGRREASARFRKRHPERVKDVARRAYECHREQRLATSARWSKANPERKAAAEQRRRAAKLGLSAEVDPAAWAAIVAAANGRCGYCGEVAPLTMDHRIPLSRGGRHEVSNLIPACKPCNSRKSIRTEDEFRAVLRAENEHRLSEDVGPYGTTGMDQIAQGGLRASCRSAELEGGLAA